MKKITFLFYFALTNLFLSGFYNTSWSQSVIAYQGFESNYTWPIEAGGSFSATSVGSMDDPASQRIRTSAHSWQVNGTTGTLELLNFFFPNYSNVKITVHLSATATLASGKGMEPTDFLKAYVSLGTAPFSATPDITLTGLTGGARWGHNAALTASTTAGMPMTFPAPQSGTSTNNYATLVINIPSNVNQVGFKLEAFSGDIAKFWNVDDITLEGNFSCSPPTVSPSNFSTTMNGPFSMRVNWTNNSGDGVLVIARKGEPVTEAPVNGLTYAASATFGAADSIGSGNYIVYNGAGNFVDVVGLIGGSTYHFSIYAYDALTHCYRQTALLGSGMTLSPQVITYNGSSAPVGNILQGSVGNLLYKTSLEVVGFTTTLNSVTATTGGNWSNADISALKLYYSTDGVLSVDDILLSTVATPIGSNEVVFNCSQLIPIGTRWLLVTCDVTPTAMVGRNISCKVDGYSDFVYSAAPNASLGSFGGANLKTIEGVPDIQLGNEMGNLAACGAQFEFGNVNANGSTATLTVRISNLGGKILNLTLPLVITGTNASQFSIMTPPNGVVDPYSYTEMVLKFTPTSAGAMTAGIAVPSDDPDEPLCTINLRGIGHLPVAHFRTIANGNWTSPSTWELSTDNMDWIPAVGTPTASNNTIIIREGHTIALETDLKLDETTIELGGTLYQSEGTLTILDGAGTDLNVWGIFKSGSPVVLSSMAEIAAEDGGRYQHSYFSSAGTIPDIYWFDGATCEILSATNKPQGLNQGFFHFIWNNPNTPLSGIDLNGELPALNGDFRVEDTGMGALFLTKVIPTTLEILGDLSISTGALLNLTGGTAPCNIVCKGVEITTNGIMSSTGAGAASFKFLASQAQLFTSPGDITGPIDFSVSNAQGVTLGSDVELPGKLTFTSGTLRTNNYTLTQHGALEGIAATRFICTCNATGDTPASSGGLNLTVPANAITVFPVGPLSSLYMPVSMMTTAMHTEDQFTARVAPLGADGVIVANPDGCVQYQWDLQEALPGGSEAYLKVQWAAGTEGANFQPNMGGYLAHWDGAAFDPISAVDYAPGDPSFTSTDVFTGFSPFVAASQLTALPISLLEFSAEKTGKSALLKFSTASERNNQYFGVERSGDGNYWKEMGRVSGVVHSDTIRQYQFTDHAPLKGKNYYRLRQVDINGTVHYSSIASLLFDLGAEILIYPLPVTDMLHFSTSTVSDAQWQVFDQTGRLVLSGKMVDGPSDYQIPVQQMASGTYLLRVIANQEVIDKSFIKH